jgi:hypothetical protein
MIVLDHAQEKLHEDGKEDALEFVLVEVQGFVDVLLQELK